MLNLREYEARPHRLCDYLPWAALVAPGVILNKDGSFQKSFRYRGPDLGSATQSEMIAASARLNNVLRRFGSGWALFFEAQREEATDYPVSDFPDAVSWLVDEERRLRIAEAGARFESRYYLTLLWLPPADSHGRVEKALIERADTAAAQGWRERLASFIARVDRAGDLLASFLPEIEALDDVGTLTYLHSTISNKRHALDAPECPVFLDAVLADEPFAGGFEPRLGDAHLRTLTILGFPGSTTPAMLDDLNGLAFPYRWATRLIALDKAAAEKILTRQRRHWFAKRKSLSNVIREILFNEASTLVDNDADNKAADADLALQELGADLVSYGYVTTSLTVTGETVADVDERLRAAERIITGRGLAIIRESLNAVEAWLGSLPGHVYANVRQPILHTLNIAHLAPMSAIWPGEASNAHLGGPALLHGATGGSTPFRLNLHVGDVGHTMIIGPTGSGKSVLLSLLALQWRRYPGSQLYLFDKGRSARATILAIGGAVIDFGSGAAPRLQPLAMIDRESERSAALAWLESLVARSGTPLTPTLKSALYEALAALASAPPAERTLTGLSLMLQDQTLKAALEPFTLEGPHGRLLDGDRDELSLSDAVLFEMETLMQQPGAVAPVLTHLFHRLAARFDGRPTLLAIDEAWLFLDDPHFSGQLRDWLKSLRKKNVAVVFATQSLADVATSSIAAAIIDSCPTRLFLPNERAREAQASLSYEQFGLNAREIELIAAATPKRDYYYRSPKGARLFDLDLGAAALALAGASTPEDHRLIDRLLHDGSDSFAARFLAAKGLPWAAELLGAWPGRAQTPPLSSVPSSIAAE